ncbi:lysophospholipid acyltransferase family protein, partial [Acinetobacter baumannii]
GSRHVPRGGALLVIVNHQSNTDPPFVQLVCPRPIHFLARRQLWEWGGLVSFMVRAWRAVPISQATADRTAIKNALELLNQGRCVGIFPEGQLSP